MKVALVHDWLVQYGGAERVLETLHEMFPDAPVYTSVYDPDRMPAFYRDWDIRSTWMQTLPLIRKLYRPLMPAFPMAFESLDFGDYDLVLASSSAFCHGVLTPPETCAVCYCHSPTRFVWNHFDYVKREGLGRLQQRALNHFLYDLRQWDRTSADRMDYFIATSHLVQQRIAKFYGRSSPIVFPPTDTSRFTPDSTHDDYFLVVSRLIPYKRIDLAIQAANQIGARLLVAGSGREESRLKKIAGPTVEFLGRIPESELNRTYARCKAFLFPGEEDYGLTPVEAMAAGRPVIAYRGGGALDTVVPGVTGEYFDVQTVECLADAMKRFQADVYDPAQIRMHAETFDTSVFRNRMIATIDECLRSYRESIPTLDGR